MMACINGNLEMKENDSRCLPVGDHVLISVKPKNDKYYTNLEPSLPKVALLAYSSMAAAHIAKRDHSYVMPMENFEAEDVTKILTWIIKTRETGKPAKIDIFRFNPIANHIRKLDMVKRMGIKELQSIFTNSINRISETKSVDAPKSNDVMTVEAAVSFP